MKQQQSRAGNREDVLVAIFHQLPKAYAYGVLAAWVASERFDLLAAIGIDRPEEQLGAPDQDKIDANFRAMLADMKM